MVLLMAMKTFIKNNMMYKKGFTLIELLVVIAIIGILSAIVLASLARTKSSATVAAGQVFDGSLNQAYAANAVALWSLDEGSGLVANDTSGNSNNLTIANDPSVHWAPKSIAYKGYSALIIDSTSSALAPAQTPNLRTFNPANGSISFWIKIQSASGSGVFCNTSDSGSPFQFCILDAGATNKFMALDWDGGGTDPITHANREIGTTLDTSSVAGKWTQVAFSWNIPTGQTVGSISEYINGQQVASSSSYGGSTFVSSDFPGPYSFCIGGDCGGDDINGSLDEFHVYSQSLQTGQIEKLYAEELPRYSVAMK